MNVEAELFGHHFSANTQFKKCEDSMGVDPLWVHQ